jgi:hypothetical protein
LQDNWKDKLKRELENRFGSYLEFETEQQRERRVNRELKKSKRELEDMVDREVRHFSCPFGGHDEILAQICSKYFLSSYIVDEGVVRKGAHLQKLPRIAILKGFSSFLREFLRYRFNRC